VPSAQQQSCLTLYMAHGVMSCPRAGGTLNNATVAFVGRVSMQRTGWWGGIMTVLQGLEHDLINCRRVAGGMRFGGTEGQG
jgi:hypothetical protein